MGDCGQLWEEGQKSFTSGRSFWKGTEFTQLHNSWVSQSFSQIFWLLFYLLWRIRYPSNPDATNCPMVKFHKNIGIRTLFSSSSSFPKKLIIFFQSVPDVVGFDGMLNYFIEKYLFHGLEKTCPSRLPRSHTVRKSVVFDFSPNFSIDFIFFSTVTLIYRRWGNEKFNGMFVRQQQTKCTGIFTFWPFVPGQKYAQLI